MCNHAWGRRRSIWILIMSCILVYVLFGFNCYCSDAGRWNRRFSAQHWCLRLAILTRLCGRRKTWLLWRQVVMWLFWYYSPLKNFFFFFLSIVSFVQFVLYIVQNPASVLAPKGMIGIAPGTPLSIGVVMKERKGLL